MLLKAHLLDYVYREFHFFCFAFGFVGDAFTSDDDQSWMDAVYIILLCSDPTMKLYL